MAAMRAAIKLLFQRMKFSVEAARAIVDEQDILDIKELGLLDDEAIANLCKIIRRPGGQVANPDYNAANPSNAPAHINNPGISISHVAQENVILAAYMVRHQ